MSLLVEFLLRNKNPNMRRFAPLFDEDPSSTTETYQMDGFDPVVETRDRERVSNYCVINEESIEGSLAKFLK